MKGRLPKKLASIYSAFGWRTINICFDPRMASSNMEQTIIHEVQHARDFCRNSTLDMRDFRQCLTYEGRACEASCSYLLATAPNLVQGCVECCTYFSCRHHPQVAANVPPNCNPSDIPARPCWIYVPEKGFVRDSDNPRCKRRKK